MAQNKNTMRVQQRGKFKTVVHDDGSTIQLICQGTLQQKTDENYYHLLIDPQHVPRIEEIDAFIRTNQPISFSPWLQGAQSLVLKRYARCPLVNDDWVGKRVEVDIRLGNFGSFGYCWLVHKVFVL